ncbi:mucin-binding protein, partial [Ligilactobacillus murinus]|uniref:mucin-binding protein n=1 Tax=Ligilactobacillus murinus TaxID=1622 RepID=UPI00117B906B
MLSKNNYKLQARKLESKRQHFTIKKFTVGVASILVGSTFAIGVSNDQVFADDTNASVVENVDETQENPPDSVTLSSTAPESTADASTDVSSNTSADQAVDANATESVADQAVDTDATGSVADQAVDTNVTGSVADQTTPESSNAQASAATPQSSAATSDAQSEANTATTPVVSEENSTASAPDTASDAQSLAGSDVANNENTTQNDTQAAPLTTSSTVNAPVTRAAVAAADDTTSTTVNSWNGLISALNNSQYQTINVSGVLTAAGTTQIFGNNRTVVIKGSDQKSGINFRDTPLKANGSWNITFDNLNLSTSSANGVVTFSDTTRQNSVTFKDVRHVGSSLYGGSGNVEVVIDGNTTSTVSNASTPTVNTYKTNGNDANIWGANSVTVANGATFTLNRSAIGDGINLPDGSTVRVGDNATMTINMNTNNATDSARYHDAGIFMLNGGNFLTGKNSTVNMNTSLGQAVSIGANRPGIGITDTNRFGGYTANQSRNDGPTTVTFGDHSTFNFTGRDGFILGNNANFTSGEYSNVHFQNKGNGVALDLANNSNIVISKHSNTLFESDGKGNKSGSEGSDSISGSYNAYNYIGVNEGGNITIDEYATFRVILTNRGSNPWDDVISLDSRNANTTAAFTSKKGAIVDIRDDNTNFYAELISFPLGAANSLIDIQDPLYLNLQRYTAGGKIDGWMPVGGTEILQTDNKHYGNLIYMGGTKGVLKIGGTDYVVYQQIKSDNAQQIWLNVNSMTSPKHGFNAAETFNNNANPDMSISGVDLTANVAANNVKDNNTSPTVKGAQGTPPYYGISSQRASHQIWFPHDTVAELIGSHQNVIRYVYEDGTPVLGSDGQPLVVTQDVDLARQFELSITPEKIQDIQNYASTHTADETLQYIRGTYVISKDSGWKVTDSTNTKTSYDAVTSPVLDGYKATIQTTNANGVTVGANADTVQATLALDPNAAITDDAFKQAYTSNVNGSLGIPTNYETVVVYKKDVQSQKVTIIYQDKSDNNKELAKDEIEGKAGDALGYSTADKIQNYLNKGYKLVSDGVPPTGTFGDAPETYYVILEHDTAPVGPTDPHDPGTPINPDDPDGPKWPTKDNYEKEYTSTVEFVDEQGNKMPNIPDDKQTSTWTRTLNVDKVTGEILNPDEAWTPDKPNYSKVNVPVVPGYYADKPVVPEKPTEQTDLVEKVVYKPMGKVTPVDPDGNPIPGGETPQYPNDPNDPTKAGTTPFPEIPGYHLEDPDKTSVTPTEPGKDTPVVYVKDEADKYNLVEKFVDENGKELAPTVTKGTDYTEGATYDVTGDKKVIDGYYLKEVPTNATGTFGKADVTVTFVYAPLGKVTPVDPDGNPIPGGETPQYPNDPNDPTKAGTTPFPEIPGYHLEDPDKTSVTPTEPGKDTPVVYVKDEADKYNLVEKFVDENGKELAPTVTK